MKEKSQLFTRLKQSKFFLAGFMIFSLLVILVIIAPFIVAFDAEHNSLDDSFTSPQYFSKGWSGYILGADNLGRDILTRVLIGTRYTLIIATGAVVFSITFGVISGLFSGYYGGLVDNLIMRFADIQLSITQLLLAIALTAVLGSSIFNIIIVIGLTGWPQTARLVRGGVLTVRESEFVAASKALGASDNWIMFSQILPNIVTPILIVASQRMGFAILIEAGLSFLGLGVQPPTPSLGGMISEGRQFLMVAPWIVMVPGVILMLAVLACNFIGDGLRDALDPKMKT